MNVLVTGAAGFIGSTVSETLLRAGHKVLGVDCFVDYYPRALKEENLKALAGHSGFTFLEKDLSAVEESELLAWLREYPLVIHEAAQAGVRNSWGKSFGDYVRHNISATQKLLEAAKQASIRRFVYASSSSVYGNSKSFPFKEDQETVPVSPYGVTKLAGENLVRLYHANYNVPAAALRYFTVYGPRQRPDMAFHKLARSLYLGEPFHVFGSGEQSRNFTYVDDVAVATAAALFSDEPAILGQAINVGGGARVTVNEAIALAEKIAGKKANVIYSEMAKGDVDRTEASLDRARKWLGYNPKTDLERGLASELEWIKRLVADKALIAE